jgi:hypothetical protein
MRCDNRTADELHHQRTNAAGVFEAVDLRNIRVIQGCERLRLAGEARQAIGVAGEMIWQNLERDVAIELRVDLTPRAGRGRAGAVLFVRF